jgi:mRNA interferase MazF
MNQHLPIVIAALLTTKIKNYKGNPILTPKPINGLKSELLIFHVRSISKDRLVEKAGNIDTTELAQAIKTLNDILTY